MNRVYRINPNVKPYPNKLLVADAEPTLSGEVSGLVIISRSMVATARRSYRLHELTLVTHEQE